MEKQFKEGDFLSINNMKNQFIPYELAVKLKELWFDEECLACYAYGGNLIYVHKNNDNDMGYYSAPLWQQIFDWFMENHNLFVSFQIFNKLDFMFKVYTVYEDLGKALVYSSNYHTTYEEARLACLEKLIEIISCSSEN